MGYLDKIPEDKAFVLGSKKLLSIKDLSMELESVSDEEYSHYASESHNYFADWVMHVIKHDKLAADLINANNRKDAVKALEKHIAKLEKKNEPRKFLSKPFVSKKTETTKDDELVKEVLKTAETNVEKKQEEQNSNTDVETSDHSIHEIEDMLKSLSKEDTEIRSVIWKHFKWELAKEFMYGMAIGILMGFVLSRIVMPW
ncbi:hypothetical protein HN789_07175 [archaeon]|jgi:hypothetical protein|nr:hypothetical protein [archaeon]MBT4021764.1 hypothetical protein [archaeon]MBT4271821.1 hypothetical protein [archaeon]MBT4460484.1 hypothetical protein [archaeon]MBT4858504.1 hypothetical protein [archaeon]